MIARILGGIYLSSIEPINNNIDLKSEYNITHILSVLPGPIPNTYKSPNYHHKQIEITDEETSNILQYFDDALSFISDAIKEKGNVLVHCAQGSSRSVIIVMAYLMKYYKLKLDQSLYAIRRKFTDGESLINPNSEFIRQLELYAEMGFKLDFNNVNYKQYVIDLNLKLDPSGHSLQQLNLFPTTSTTTEDDNTTTTPPSDLRCKRCRQILSKSNQIEYHDAPDSDSRQSQFIKTAPNSRRIIKVQEASLNCSHFFLIEPLNWMKPELERGDIEGKFQCPKCSAKVGGYSWKGSRCSCGKWMVPAIHLQTAKVDDIKNMQLNQSI
ncbi:Yvh1 dual specificity phosphatase [Scheffersomyces coipomensis]|uniref:Yvh1 dual specificity phosphatase n=1 Tax=Scheffersomyces coipomensis TaxID=1788519 RepID=UPI00315D8000